VTISNGAFWEALGYLADLCWSRFDRFLFPQMQEQWRSFSYLTWFSNCHLFANMIFHWQVGPWRVSAWVRERSWSRPDTGPRGSWPWEKATSGEIGRPVGQGFGYVPCWSNEHIIMGGGFWCSIVTSWLVCGMPVEREVQRLKLQLVGSGFSIFIFGCAFTGICSVSVEMTADREGFVKPSQTSFSRPARFTGLSNLWCDRTDVWY